MKQYVRLTSGFVVLDRYYLAALTIFLAGAALRLYVHEVAVFLDLPRFGRQISITQHPLLLVYLLEFSRA
jgi:hypothetical protein